MEFWSDSQLTRVFDRRRGMKKRETPLNFAEGKINRKRYEETVAEVCIGGFLTNCR